jgi:GTPase
MPGMTRDRKELVSDILGYPVKIVDTAGWEFQDQNQS